VLEVFGDGGEVGGRWRVCGLVGRFEESSALLGVEVVEPRLEAGCSNSGRRRSASKALGYPWPVDCPRCANRPFTAAALNPSSVSPLVARAH
jgi:hypothetical protein